MNKHKEEQRNNAIKNALSSIRNIRQYLSQQRIPVRTQLIKDHIFEICIKLGDVKEISY